MEAKGIISGFETREGHQILHIRLHENIKKIEIDREVDLDIKDQ